MIDLCPTTSAADSTRTIATPRTDAEMVLVKPRDLKRPALAAIRAIGSMIMDAVGYVVKLPVRMPKEAYFGEDVEGRFDVFDKVFASVLLSLVASPILAFAVAIPLRESWAIWSLMVLWWSGPSFWYFGRWASESIRDILVEKFENRYERFLQSEE